MDLLTKEEIEKAGFVYEPDATKCKTRKIRFHVDCNYYKDGQWTCRTTPPMNDEWKAMLTETLVKDAYYWSHLNRVFIPEVEPWGGEGVMCRWAMISGWGDPLAKRWIETGLLENLKPNQFPDAASYFNRVAQEVIEKTKDLAKESPEFLRWDTISGILLPVARSVFDKYPTRPDPKFLVEDVARFYDEHKALHEACNSYICQDGDKQLHELYIAQFQWVSEKTL